MSRGEWKIDENDEAVFIDCEEEATCCDAEYEYSHWASLPDLLLEQVFAYLSIRERYYASMVCRSWRRAFSLPYVWHSFTLCDDTLTRRKFNYYYGWQHTLDHFRTQQCVTRIGRHLRRLSFRPASNFYNLFEFMNMVSWYAEQGGGVASRVHTLSYVFPCNMANNDTEQARTFGTGGKLLDSLKRLMGNLASLRCLELVDLLLEPVEAQHLLDEVCCTCCLTLNKLAIVNVTKLKYQILHPGVFLNLQVLVMSPQNLGPDLLSLLTSSRLRHLHLVQNRYSPPCSSAHMATTAAWRACRRDNPALRVHLELRDVTEATAQPAAQPGAPVHSVLIDADRVKLSTASVMSLVELYGRDLRVFACARLPRYYVARSFHERTDHLMLMLVKQCPLLHTLMIRERVSTSTVLLLAKFCQRLSRFVVRRNAVILRCDWPRSPDWSPAFYAWLQDASRSYEAVEREVATLLGQDSWHMMSDRQFKMTELDLHAEY